MNQQANPTIKVSGITNYLHNKYIRLWSYFIICPEGGFYVLDGIRIPVKDFETMYPIQLNNLND